MTDIVTAIDRAVGCQHCGAPLGDSPSDDFCQPDCQEDWHAARTEQLVGYREPWDRPWDFPGIGTDAYFADDGSAVATIHGPRGFTTDLVIVDELWNRILIRDPSGLQWMSNATGPLYGPVNGPQIGPANGPLTPAEAALEARRTRNTGPNARGRPPRTIGRPNTARR